MIKWLGLTVISVFVGGFTYLYFYLGANEPVITRVEIYPALHLLYVEHRGAYHKINSKLEAVESRAQSAGIACQRTFGKFLDNPQTTDQDRLRSHVGCVLDEPLSQEEALAIEAQFVTQPSQRYIYAQFKGSPAIGPFVVYPELAEVAKKERLLVADWSLEIYTISRTGTVSTEYLMPIQ